MRVLGVALALIALAWTPAQSQPARDLAGVWYVKKRFGPEIRGSLTVEQLPAGWRASIAGNLVPARVTADTIAFELPPDRGAFVGRFQAGRQRIVGHWIQPRTVTSGTRYASPVVLVARGDARWEGEVVPLEDEFTYYLAVRPRADGSMAAFIRNPERNLGRFIRVDQLERDGPVVRLRARDSSGVKGGTLAEGTYRNDVLTLPLRGGTYDFVRVPDDALTNFYPRGKPTVLYSYAPPQPRNDGWNVGTVTEVGIDRDGITRFIRMLANQTIDSVSVPEIHALLIARRGKLVVEEYFHGEQWDKPHDTRSAAKSLTATMIGAAIRAGFPVSPATPVYETMLGAKAVSDLDPRKRALTLEHLLTMSSGLDCDDTDPTSPGNEDVMAEQEVQPDYYKYILDLKTIRDPGERGGAVYCSINPHLAGGVLARATKRSLPMLFQDLIATPLQITRYHMNLAPTGDAYMGGGVRFLPRDFMKLGQVMLDGGVWSGRQVLPPAFVQRAASPLVPLRGLRYGYLWWVTDYPYHDRKVRAYFAGGNGGQLVMVIPELELVVATFGGNYSDAAVSLRIQQQYVPQFILPAID